MTYFINFAIVLGFEEDSFPLRTSKRCELCFDFENCISDLLWKVLPMHRTTIKASTPVTGRRKPLNYSMTG